MAFVKLDCGILQSTIWFDKAARDVFLTALLLAEPAVFDQPQKQISVESLDYTGWEAPPGWYGFVPACGAAIIGRAMVDDAPGRDALKRLGEPEPTSRSPEFGGRRLIRIDGGYLVLNYMKHRDKDHTAAERSRRYRERLASQSSHRDLAASRRDITQAEAEAEAEADLRSETEKKRNSPAESKESAGAPPKVRKFSKIPDAWQPTAKHAEKAKHWPAGRYALELEKFRNWDFKTPRIPDRAWSVWIASVSEKLPPAPSAAVKPTKGFHREY